MLDSMEADRTFVAQKDAQILELEAQIDILQKSISLLRAARQPASERLDSYRYPVLTLPVDVINEVFIHFLPPYPTPPPLSGTSSPMILTQICSQWRGIALSIPTLWRAINLVTPQVDYYKAHAHAASLAPLWLHRSGSLPLSIHATNYDEVEDESGGKEEDENEYLPDFSSLAPYCARWEHLTLVLEDASPLEAVRDSMPLLRSLDLWFGIGCRNPVVIQDVPLLRTLNLSDFGSASVSVPWSQLTSLTLGSMYKKHVMAILRQTPHLVHCSLHFWPNGEPLDDVSDVVLLRLETLEFEEGSQVDAAAIQILVTPALLCLEIPENSLRWASSLTEWLKTYISKSGCKLRELRITEANSCAQIYHDAFPSIPTIKHTESGA